MGKHTAHGYLVEDVYKEAENSKNCLVLNQRGLMRHLPDFRWKERWSFFCGSGNI